MQRLCARRDKPLWHREVHTPVLSQSLQPGIFTWIHAQWLPDTGTVATPHQHSGYSTPRHLHVGPLGPWYQRPFGPSDRQALSALRPPGPLDRQALWALRPPGPLDRQGLWVLRPPGPLDRQALWAAEAPWALRVPGPLDQRALWALRPLGPRERPHCRSW